ncbi:MAG: nitroreductase family protein [Bacteroidaceae bacterium]|nr:nitroreductase family protein [Bacteroidaceae bacterium]
MINIDSDKCTRCGKCRTVCPTSIPIIEKGHMPRLRHPEACISCGHCVDVCPTGAFEHDAFPAKNIHTVNRDLLPSPESLMELIRSRRSNRTITAAPIPRHALDMILEAARYAPTAENSRQVHLHLVTDWKTLHDIEAATMGFFMRLARVMLFPPVKTILRPFMRKLYDEAPALLSMNEKFRQGQHPSICEATALLVISAPRGYDFGSQDCNLAYQNASLMAESLGVSQIYMGFVQTAMFMMGTRKAARILGIPHGHKAFAIMGLGMPAFRYGRYTDR